MRDRPQENEILPGSKLLVDTNWMLPPPWRLSVSPVPLKVREDMKLANEFDRHAAALNKSLEVEVGVRPGHARDLRSPIVAPPRR